MVTKVSISLSWVGSSPDPNLPPGVHHISELMPAVLTSHGLDADSEQPTVSSMAADF